MFTKEQRASVSISGCHDSRNTALAPNIDFFSIKDRIDVLLLQY